MNSRNTFPAICFGLLIATAVPATAGSFFFSTGNVTDSMAVASRPDTPGFEIEAADDFVLTAQTIVKSATFTGLLPSGANISNVTAEIYRVFPKDSDVGRTSGPPTFSTPQVSTRVNSPSDVAFASRSSGIDLTFTTAVMAPNFTVLNTVLPGGIHPSPNQRTGGNGPVTGQEVQFSLTFTTPLNLAADHYFFVPQVQLDNGDFRWLSASRPIVAPGTPFNPDLQAWTRDAFLDSDWLRVGTDIVGGNPAPTFNMAFTLDGDIATPLPAAMPVRRRSRRSRSARLASQTEGRDAIPA